ncbi:MAG TPA: tetratricopeptide repeat protein [candidate division Zixibacteria bacterium]|nr:tetratricopeptide repeat protein [candidate division Zixibacteria bacterium]MDD4918266.1 tetratricopeptide repeat protein [candidate division Zixibacteria bacterium]MDM7973165.1 tetratricopeptide repeat protein [candidate division Zixibacteria bacterium]HOD65845.1 tetratricopeptide repeat protein [candidate division Zixibacteria bacterium]HPM38399.1 tetratricopeptide repeat protein [candidate division Zixibacteria bacterium]
MIHTMDHFRTMIARVVVPVLLLLAAGCGAYYNTFYNAKRAFNQAESERRNTKPGQPERILTGDYQTAIEKSLKVVENHPNSKYYDDAVFVLGVSYYYTNQFAKAERRFREILANYPDGQYARDSKLYLAKAMLRQDAVAEAMDLFAELFESDLDRSFKAEAAMALGKYQFEQGRYQLANRYFLAIRDSLGADIDKRVAQRYIADGLMAQFRYNDALAAYLQVLGMDPAPPERYHAMFSAAQAAFRLQRIDVGQDYLSTLAKDNLYFDSLSSLRLAMADGYEWQGNLIKAEEMYRLVSDEAANRDHKAQANLALGLIYQYDYDDLAKAKEFYDAAAAASRGSSWGQEALQLSSNIGKLETFARTVKLDSTTTQAQIDDAAYTQYQLAELYWYQLSKPDSAMAEMQYLVDSFPTAYDAPKAMIALAQMAWQSGPDSARGDSIIREMLGRYPHSDFVPEALGLLGLAGTEADTGYAEWYIRRAENFAVDDENIDSALANYQVVTERFPESKFYLQAKFAGIWLTETYRSPGDSSILWAYQAIADSFPSTEWGQAARSKLTGQPIRTLPKAQPADTITGSRFNITDSSAIDTMAEGESSDTVSMDDKYLAIITAPDGSRCVDIPPNVGIIETRKEFVYPSEAYVSRWEGQLHFQIRLDFSGEVQQAIPKTFADVQEINIRAKETVESTVFDMRLIRPELLDRWFLYVFTVNLPSHLR